jgi:hypothetical protein
MTAFRIGAGSGFSGDRYEPARILIEGGELDALVFECLAERTIGLAQQAMTQGTSTGFDPRILERLRDVLPAAAARRTKIISNAGAANPLGAARAAHDLADELGLGGLTVAAVTGDDVKSLLSPQARVLGTEETIGDLGDRVVSANAYLGTEGLTSALDEGADIVLTGRVGDAALFAAPLIRHFGWGTATMDRLADATLVGHLLECAGQLTGGYFADGGRKTVPGLATLGFPWAEVSADGSAVYGKVEGTGGMITSATVLEQLLYEIDDARSYLTPDVALDMSNVRISDRGNDRVHVHGAVARGRPEQLKVSVGVRDGYLAAGEIVYGGHRALERARLAEQIVRERWSEAHKRDAIALRCDYLGVNATRPWWDGWTEPGEVRMRFTIRSFERADGVLLLNDVESLYTNGPAGGGGVTTSIQETIGIVSTMIDRDAVGQRVEVIR